MERSGACFRREKRHRGRRIPPSVAIDDDPAAGRSDRRRGTRGVARVRGIDGEGIDGVDLPTLQAHIQYAVKELAGVKH